jgi:eukaryotic-like serine/threonine-protein kinase
MQPPLRIPGYDLLQFLGGGPITQVFSARDCQTDALRAVKLLRPEWEKQPAGLKLIQREARAGLVVRHPRLVRLLFAHVTSPPYFIVMELLPGESLRQRLRREYRLDPASALWNARQVAEGLAALHRAGFVHGDVKPDNIRLLDDGTSKLIDLGFAHRPGENAVLVKEGYFLGTADYLAPELCSFERDAEPGSDLFSLGATLFEMLSGRLPYPPGNTKQTLRRHQCDPPGDVRRFVPELPGEVARLIDSLLSLNPDRRPSATALVQRLIGLEIATLSQRRSA